MKLNNEERDLIVAEALASIVHLTYVAGDTEAYVIILGQVVVFDYVGFWWPAGTHYSYTYRQCDTLEKAIINYLKITRRRKP